MDIKDYRDALDELDAQLVELFCKRMDICGKVAEWKQANGKPIYDRSRERARRRSPSLQDAAPPFS